MASLTTLPTELLVEIVQYLRPQNKNEPITGRDGAYKHIEKFRESLASSNESESAPSAPLFTYSTLRALNSTSRLLRVISMPILYENLNILSAINSFEDYYSFFVLPNASYFRHIRLIIGTITDDEAARILRACKHATSVALYSNRFRNKTEDDLSFDLTSTEQATLELFEEGEINTLGLYSPSMLDPTLDYGLFTTESLPIVHHLSRNSKGKLALRRLDLTIYEMTEEVYDLICSEFPSLEALNFYFVIDSPLRGIWDNNERVKWAQYSNLTRLQFIECGRAYCNQISHLVRHFPSLLHLLLSISDDGRGGRDLKPDDWYDRKDALWKVRKPLEMIHIEHCPGGKLVLWLKYLLEPS